MIINAWFLLQTKCIFWTQSFSILTLFKYIFFSGYKYVFNDQLVTVWSAPNYCYRCGNVASILEFSDVDTRTPKLFEAVPDSNRVIPPRITTPYFLWNYLLHLWSSLMSSNQILGPKDSENIFEIFNLVVKIRSEWCDTEIASIIAWSM